MEQYIVSARKYRPIDFHAVVGQEVLTSTLKNAIATNHLAHAYLFCGPRGVGKTTCARIFAKTINCTNRAADGEACDACDSCRSFNEQRSFNIHELDAASNNSVDDIRSLVEQVRIPPQVGKYSVYIIDEVHMLSQGAFNAFLKTLEEPPSYAIFILATTEKHKIIPTILSRCQIYDFNRIKVPDMVSYLQYIAGKEQIEAEPEALNVIAQKADGAMRDALSIFDQVVSFCGSKVTYQAVIDNLNVLDYDYYFKLVDFFLNGNVTESLLLFNTILNKGFDALHFVSGLASHLRDLLVSRDAATLPLLEVGQSQVEQYRAQAQRCPQPFLYAALEAANRCDLAYRAAKNKRLLVELMLIELCQITDASAVQKKKSEPSLKRIVPTDALQPSAAAPGTPSPTPSPQPSQPTVVQPTVVSTAATASTTQASQQPTPRPQAVPTRPNGLQTVSIRLNNSQPAATGQQEEAAPTVVAPSTVAEKRAQTFTQQQLQAAWRKFADSVRTEVHLYNTMHNFPPTSDDNAACKVSLANQNQMRVINEYRPKIEVFLADTLENDHIRLVIAIDETLGDNMAFTSEDKLALMIKKNPDFGRLKEQFNLDIEP